MRIAILLMLTFNVGMAMAAEEVSHDASHEVHAASHAEVTRETTPHPRISDDTTWAGAMVIVIIGMFVAAAAVGVVVRANMPDEPPQPDAHHDDHGHGSHDAHHGSAGHH
jgi:hypothetical protein